MEMIIDFMLLAASAVATIYCFVLSRRLAKLNDLKNGIGASISSMSSALDQTQEVLSVARNSSLEGVQRLADVLEEAERVKPEIKQLLEALSDLADLAAQEIEETKKSALNEIDARLTNGRTREKKAA